MILDMNAASNLLNGYILNGMEQRPQSLVRHIMVIIPRFQQLILLRKDKESLFEGKDPRTTKGSAFKNVVSVMVYASTRVLL